ncbi:ABC transporter transmembrane region 2-domain-containing protein [Lobosporangium transversale]|uniref:ABC transporter transmembrane region 2-domain-containing protein n=1 Tax=Lobosporangium transversale TaxID=64571 RepID=A0A1Y2GQN2_9FUNG|nr:ABC transporter transmembrane region 2-domain-containing protein [Lobosporangium transversale]ORZ16636.1 ABC transporter transmembrane region 2-domain-containing protein [Lobosporangium transversale]|eukprot:XP_021881571.1 ABC transporter transmembrane region 2-domain-containing protein [Lobosporangium transversale]
MAPVVSLPLGLHRKSRSSLAGLSILLAYILVRRQQTRAKRRARQQRAAAGTATGSTSDSSAGNKPRRVGVDRHFVEQLKKLLPICIPGLASREAGLLAALATILIARTWLDVWFSGLNGSVVKAIVSRDRKRFIAKAMIEFGLMMWPMSIVNNSLKFTISALALSFRERLTKFAHNQYLDGITFYKVSNIDNRIQNADQLLTQDIDKFADNLSHLYSDIAKPLVDIVLFAYKLGEAIGGEAPFYMIGYFFLSGVVLRALSPPFGKYTALEQKLEGDFRFAHSRIITHSEEIAFYNGAAREKDGVNNAFDKISRHVKKVYTMRFANGILDSVLVKYCATMTAYYLLARPVFDPAYATEHMGRVSADPTKIVEDYSRNFGRLILAGRDLTRFAGYTSRVSELFDVLDDIKKGRYERTMIAKNDTSSSQSQSVDTNDLKGKVITQDGVIIFEKVPIVTPNNDVLVKELSFKVTKGTDVIIAGPNGCGKSSLFRILGDLWPLFGGTVTKPHPSKLFYVPQKPYLALGTFRDQVIYPDTKQQALAKGFTDAKLFELLSVVHLGYLIDREGGWDSVQDWADVLSGGEKQRVAMARLFYHRPQFAILDECTSAVSIDVEGIMYEHARQSGITLFTVSHRPSLIRYHEYLLRFDGEGNYQFRKLGKEDIQQTAFGFGHGKSKKIRKLGEEDRDGDDADTENSV